MTECQKHKDNGIKMSPNSEPKAISNMFFSVSLSHKIINTLLSGEKNSWEKQVKLLDHIIPKIIEFGYFFVPGIKKRMDRTKVKPYMINDFESYEELFPETTVLEMSEMGQNEFELNRGDYQSTRSKDMSLLADIILREEVGEKKNKRSGMIKVRMTNADARAASLALAGYMKRQDDLPSEFIINQKRVDPKKGALIGDYLLSGIIAPAFESIGIQIRNIDEITNLRNLGSGQKTGLFLPGGKYSALQISDLQDFQIVVNANSEKSMQKTIPIGDYNQNFGLFPLLGYQSPLFGLLRVVGFNGKIPRDKLGLPNTNERGLLVMDRFLSAYEMPTEWTVLKNTFDNIYDLFQATGADEINLANMFQEIGNENLFRLFEQTGIFKKIDFDKKGTISIEELNVLNSFILENYYRTSLRIGIPSSTWMLKVRMPFVTKVDPNGIMSSAIPLQSGSEGYILAKQWRVKYSPEQTPYTNLHIIGAVESAFGFPEESPALIKNRVLDQLGGNELFGSNNPGYLYSAGVVGTNEFRSMLLAAKKYSKPREFLSPLTIDEILDILSALHSSVVGELSNAYDEDKRDRSMISVFAEKTRIPISEIADMVKRAKEDFIDSNGQGLKKILYSAFIDSNADFSIISEEDLSKGLGAIKQKKCNSPAFMVIPGNITLYDSFDLFAQILMALLSNQSEKSFTMYERPSESDITFNYLVHKFHHLAKKIDPMNHKGLRTLFQKAYWDPNYDEEFLMQGMKEAQVGMYYGTAKTYSKARFEAAIFNAKEETHFDDKSIDQLCEIAERKKVQYDPKGLNEIALYEGIDSNLLNYVLDFTSRHKLYPQTLNGSIILPDEDNLKRCAETIVDQVISLRGADCTNVSKLWVFKDQYDTFMNHFDIKAGKLTYGDIFHQETRLASYDTDYLKGTKGIVNSRDDTKIISPTNVKTGEITEEPINPKKNYTGIIVTKIQADILIGGDPFDRDEYLRHLARDQPLPWLNIIVYDDIEQAIESMENVLTQYSKDSGYPRYLYIAAMGNDMGKKFEESIMTNNIADLVKIGEEAYKQFMYYRPHQGSFFINDFVG